MESTRRDFLKVAGGAVALSSLVGTPLAMAAGQEKAKSDKKMTAAVAKNKLPDLPYGYNALEPYIDEETLRLHHDKHHAAYVKGLNKAEEELAKARTESNYAMIQHWSRKAAFAGGGHFLHSMFWQVMAPASEGGGEPQDLLAKKIKEDFGSFKAFKDHFTAVASSVEGSGWGLLHYRATDEKLVILQAENHHELSPWGVTPVMCIDVWEHAYYLKYQNKRDKYIEAWWNVVNWAQVGKNLMTAMKYF